MVAETIEKLSARFYMFACFKYLNDHTDLIPAMQRQSLSPRDLRALAYVRLSNGTIAIHPKIEASISGFVTRSKIIKLISMQDRDAKS